MYEFKKRYLHQYLYAFMYRITRGRHARRLNSSDLHVFLCIERDICMYVCIQRYLLMCMYVCNTQNACVQKYMLVCTEYLMEGTRDDWAAQICINACIQRYVHIYMYDPWHTHERVTSQDCSARQCAWHAAGIS